MLTISVGLHGADQQRLNALQRNTERTQTSVERLTTGKRINRPKDDPAGFIAAEGLRRDLADLRQKLGDISAERADSHTRQSGLAQIQDVLTDIRGRIVSAADGSLTADQRAAFEAEVDAAVEAVNRIAGLTGNKDSIDFSAGGISLSASSDAAEFIDNQSHSVATERATLGADEHASLDTFENLYQDQAAITSQALSQIEDTDFAAETANLVQSQILTQSSIAALAYSGRQQVEQLTLLLNAIA